MNKIYRKIVKLISNTTLLVNMYLIQYYYNYFLCV